MNLTTRVQDILLKPKKTWTQIKSEEVSITGIYGSYACIMAAIPPAAQIIGLAFIGTSFIGTRYRVSLATTLGEAVLSYCVSLAALYIIALVINFLAPKFASRKDLTNAFKLATFSWTPSWIAGLALLAPSLAWFTKLISLYGFYLFYLGLPVLMDTPRERVDLYFISAIALSAIFVGFILSVVALVFPLPTVI